MQREVSWSVLLLGTVLGALLTCSLLIPAQVLWGICVLFSSKETKAQRRENITGWIHAKYMLGEPPWGGSGRFSSPREGHKVKRPSKPSQGCGVLRFDG